MKKILVLICLFVLVSSVVFANGEHTFEEAEEIIESKTPCEQLTEEQLETIGDYYMEQMHPGEEHETMDEMMGGEGSESLKQMHVNMAKSFYCGEHDAMPSNMVDIMMGRSNTGMMGSGSMRNMMGSDTISTIGGENMAYGMMGDYSMMGGIGASLFGLVYFAIVAFVFSVIFWLTRNWLVKNKKKQRGK